MEHSNDIEKIETKDLVDIAPINNAMVELVDDIIKEDDTTRLKKLTNLFNLNQTKKNALRILRLNELLDLIQDQMIERFETSPLEFENKELLDYMQVIQSAIDRANKSLDLIDHTPTIQLNQVNVEMPILNHESRERVREAIQAIRNKIDKITKQDNEQEVLNIEEE